MSVVTEEQQVGVRMAPRALAAGGTRGLVANQPASPRSLPQRLRGAVVPYLSRQVQSVGSAGVAGVALMVFAVAFYFGANSSLHNAVADLQSTLDTAQSVRTGPRSAAPAPPSELQAFVKGLPMRSELPALTGLIVAQAAAAGISLERGTYDFTVSHSGSLVRARMSFPVHGRYTDIRRFIDGTLAALPDAAIDGLRFERKDVGAAEIDADIRFALYLRAGP